MGSRNICTICQEIFLFQIEDRNEQPYALKCGHVFHNKCLSQWKANVNKCPQCRATAQNPIRLFFISDSEHNREELDAYMLQAELDKEKTNCQSLKKKYEETCETLETVKEKSKRLQMLNDELEHLIPSFKDCINNLRKENKNYLQSIHNLENEVKEYRQKIESYSNIKDILDEKVDSIAVEKYKNMKPDMIANIVNQWKRNAQYYKQKELSDRNRYMELQEELKRYKQDNVKCKTSLDSLQQEVKILRNVVERQKTDKSSTDMNNYIGMNSDDDLDFIESSSKTSSSELKRPNTSFVNVSPLVKRMKITNVLALNKKPTVLLGSTNSSEESSSLKHTSSSNSAKVLQTKSINSSDSLKPLQSKPSHLLQTTGANQRTLKYLTSNNLTNKTNIKSSSLFKKTHSFKSTRDIINYFDK